MNDSQVFELQNKLDDIFVFDQDLPKTKDCAVTFVDFAPTIKYERDSTKTARYIQLIEFCNKWLQTTGCWDVICCETLPAILKVVVNGWSVIENLKIRLRYSITRERPVKWKSKKNQVKFQFMVQTLRVWIRPFINNCPIDRLLQVIPEIQYKDFVPKLIDDNVFENIDSVVERVNQSIRNEEILGKIINVQTLGCCAEQDWTIDEESTQSKTWIGKVVFILRVFYILGPKQEEEIGFNDFIPQFLINQKERYESQHTLFWGSYIWLLTQPQFKLINFCSVDSKLDSHPIDTKQMSMTRETGYYVRFRRLIYAKPKTILLSDTQTSTKHKFEMNYRNFTIRDDYRFKAKVVHCIKHDWKCKMFEHIVPNILCCESVLLLSDDKNKSMNWMSANKMSYKSRHLRSSIIICYAEDIESLLLSQCLGALGEPPYFGQNELLMMNNDE